MAQLVEHILGKDEVPSSNLGSSSKKSTCGCRCFLVCPPSACRRGILPRMVYCRCRTVVSGFRGGYPICGSVSAAPGGLSGITLGFSRGFARRLHPRLSACGLCTLSFIIINHKLRLTAGRLRLRVCAFAAVCGISSVRGFFIYRRAARISPEMRNFAGIVFCREAHLRTALPSSAEKFFPAFARCRAKVSFRRIFRSDRGGRKCVRQSSEKRHILQV